MSNSVHGAYLSRLITIETERRDNAEDRKDLMAEMRKLPKHERDGIILRMKWHFQTEEKVKEQQMSFDFALGLSAA